MSNHESLCPCNSRKTPFFNITWQRLRLPKNTVQTWRSASQVGLFQYLLQMPLILSDTLDRVLASTWVYAPIWHHHLFLRNKILLQDRFFFVIQVSKQVKSQVSVLSAASVLYKEKGQGVSTYLPYLTGSNNACNHTKTIPSPSERKSETLKTARLQRINFKCIKSTDESKSSTFKI